MVDQLIDRFKYRTGRTGWVFLCSSLYFFGVTEGTLFVVLTYLLFAHQEVPAQAPEWVSACFYRDKSVAQI